MPIDFRTYQDPGVYIETITPPVVFTAAIEPTILAIVGEAPDSRDVFESTNLITGSWVDLANLGGDPSTLKVKDRLLGEPYVSAAIGSLNAAIDDNDTALVINLFDADWIEPAADFSALIEDEEVTVDVSASSISNGVYTVTLLARGVGATDAVAHGVGQVVNDIEGYDDTASLEVAELSAPLPADAVTFEQTALGGVQTVTLTGLSGTDSFKLTYNGFESAIITRGTNYDFAGIKAAIEGINGGASIDTVSVTAISGSGALTDAGFQVRFEDPNTGILPLTVTSGVGVTGTVANRGIVTGTYLDVEGERMLVTGVAGDTITVVRGVAGTTPAQHGSTELYENSGADYLVRIGSGEDGDFGTADDTVGLYILDRISNGAYVNVAFQVTDAEQFSAGLYDDLDTIRDKYGDPLDENGQVLSELSLGAQVAMANGATQLVLIAANPDDTNPIQDAIEKLEFEQSVNSIALLSGNAVDIAYLRGHVITMSEQGNLRRAFVGLDGTSSPIPTSSDFITKAGQMNSERVSLVAPSRFKLDNGTGTPIIVPGYFGAAAVAGIQAGLPPQEPLTRKQVFGFVGIAGQDTTQNVFLMQASGVLVVFEDRLGRLVVKHGLTTDMSSVYTREISVITARDRLRDFIMETLEGGALIGSPITSETPNLVSAAVNAALEESQRQGLIFDYSDVKFKFPTESPTLIQIRFSYKPTLPLNYILVQFSIDTNTGTVDFQNVNDNTSEG